MVGWHPQLDGPEFEQTHRIGDLLRDTEASSIRAGLRILIAQHLELSSFHEDASIEAAAAAAAAKSLQSCPTLCDPRDSNPPGSPVPGILQARTMEWVNSKMEKKSKMEF